MKRLIILLLLGVFFAFADWSGWGDPSHFKVPIEFDSTVTINDDLYVKDSTFLNVVVDSNRHLCLAPLFITESNTNVDTSLYIKKYGARTGYVGLVFDVDTSENTAANVKLIDMSENNVVNNASDYYLYLAPTYYWNGYGELRTGKVRSNVYRSDGTDVDWGMQSSHDFILNWVATHKGDIIFRDGNLGVANPDFFQIQDSAGNIQTQIGNTGIIKMENGKLVTADSVRFVGIFDLSWWGSGLNPTDAAGYYNTNGVDDDLYSFNIGFPYLVAGGTVVVDSMYINYYTQGTEDSIKIMVHSLQNGVKTKVDSTAWLYGATGWRQSPTLIPNGALTVADNTGYTLWANCDNDGAADIRLEFFVCIVYHLVE